MIAGGSAATNGPGDSLAGQAPLPRGKVSIIIPCRNEAGSIPRTLEGLLAQSIKSEWMEVILADGMSTDGTRAIVEAFRL